MKLYKHFFRFLFTKYNLLLNSILIIIFILFRFVVDLNLAPSNVTWIYSSSMQTLAALIALLPISYGYYINNLDNEKNEGIDSYVINRLKSDVYYDMMTVIVYSLFVIVVNLLSFFLVYNVIFSLVVGLLTIEGIGLISLYIYRLFDPNKVKEIFKEFDTSTDKSSTDQSVSLDTFITKYLELETAVKDFISNKNDNELIDNLPLYDIVDNLSKDFPEINEHYETFKEIIYHRNNVIHNYIETIVDSAKYEKVLELTDLFDKYNNMFIQKNIFGNVVKVKNVIEVCLKEYLLDTQNDQLEIGNVAEDLKEDVTSLLSSYFISDYFNTLSLEKAKDTDFEVIQNNYSERKLVGIDVKSIIPKNLKSIANSYFKRLQNRFMYLFLINYNPNKNSFIVMYKTKDNELRSIVVQAK